MARAALELSVSALAEAAKVPAKSISRLEHNKPSKEHIVDAIQTTLEAAGVEFIPENGSGPGVRLKTKTQTPEQLSIKIANLHEALPEVDEKAKPSPHKAMKQLELARQKRDCQGKE